MKDHESHRKGLTCNVSDEASPTSQRLTTVLCVFGTRPEAIKMAPVVTELKKNTSITTRVCVTAQHREMLDQVLDQFNIVPDSDLDLMTPGQSLNDLTAEILISMPKVFDVLRPDIVIVHGDTTTAFATALAAFNQRIPIAHVEAGLRTRNLQSPWPEELNRTAIAKLADLHFAPTIEAKTNLLTDGVPENSIHVTGNTIVDALLAMRNQISSDKVFAAQFIEQFPFLSSSGDLVLITGHRRENLGARLENVCIAISELAKRFPNNAFVYPVHLNPNVLLPVSKILAGLPNVHLVKPVDYLTMVCLMDRATLIMTDSGGIQEEAPSFHVPVLVTRDCTERPEAVRAGTARLVGASVTKIVESATELLTSADARQQMVSNGNPFGDGTAAVQIAAAVIAWATARHAST